MLFLVVISIDMQSPIKHHRPVVLHGLRTPPLFPGGEKWNIT